MADKPSRALIIYGYGLASSIKSSHAHIHALASHGCCGFLALKHLLASDNKDEILVMELAQLLDAYETSRDAVGEKTSKPETHDTIPAISERFMGMKAAVVTNSSAVKSLGESLGFVGIELSKLRYGETSSSLTAFELLRLLGFEDGKISETSQFDLAFVHLGSSEKSIGREEDSTAEDTEYLNNLVGQILQITRQCSAIRSRLHLSLVMSYGAVSEEDPSLSLSALHDENNSDFSVLFPRQSFTMEGGKLRTNIRKQCPLLVTQWQEAVTRKDKTEMFSFDDFRENSGSLAIPADRFLHEIAFKLWKAPKYGA